MSARAEAVHRPHTWLASLVLLVAIACDGGAPREREPAGSALLADSERLVWKRSLFVDQLMVLERGGGAPWQPFAELGSLRFGAAVATASGSACVVSTANAEAPAEHVLFALRKDGPRGEQLLRLHESPLVEPFAWRVLGDEVAFVDRSGVRIVDARRGAPATRVFVAGDFTAVRTGPWNHGWLQAGHLVCGSHGGLFTIEVATGAVRQLSTAADARPYATRDPGLPWLVWLEYDGPAAQPRCVAGDVATGERIAIAGLAAQAPTEAIWIDGRVWARCATTPGDEDLLVADLDAPAPAFRNATMRAGRGPLHDWFTDVTGERAVCTAGTEVLVANGHGLARRLDAPGAPAVSSVYSARWLGDDHVLFVREGLNFGDVSIAAVAVANSEQALWPGRRSLLAWGGAPAVQPPASRVRRCDLALVNTLAPRELFAVSIAGGQPESTLVTAELAPSFSTRVAEYGDRLVYRSDDTLVAIDLAGPTALAISGPGVHALAPPADGDPTVLFLREGALWRADARRGAGEAIAEVRLTPPGVEAIDLAGRAGTRVLLLARSGARVGLWIAGAEAHSARFVDHHPLLPLQYLTTY